jgi:hypothetical protein
MLFKSVVAFGAVVLTQAIGCSSGTSTEPSMPATETVFATDVPCSARAKQLLAGILQGNFSDVDLCCKADTELGWLNSHPGANCDANCQTQLNAGFDTCVGNTKAPGLCSNVSCGSAEQLYQSVLCSDGTVFEDCCTVGTANNCDDAKKVGCASHGGAIDECSRRNKGDWYQQCRRIYRRASSDKCSDETVCWDARREKNFTCPQGK